MSSLLNRNFVYFVLGVIQPDVLKLKKIKWTGNNIEIESQDDRSGATFYNVASTSLRMRGVHLVNLVMKDSKNELEDLEFELVGPIFTEHEVRAGFTKGKGD